jgi:hypothetical protein
MNEKDLQSALQDFLVYKHDRKRLATRVCESFIKDKHERKRHATRVRVILVNKNERKRLATRVASLFSIQKLTKKTCNVRCESFKKANMN